MVHAHLFVSIALFLFSHLFDFICVDKYIIFSFCPPNCLFEAFDQRSCFGLQAKDSPVVNQSLESGSESVLLSLTWLPSLSH